MAKVAVHEAALIAQPQTAGGPKDVFKFDAKIYGHASVKEALKACQHRKCAYCEAYFEGNAAGDVEHFRPKAYSQQATGSAKLYPGYYWLAYTWTNLLYSCEPCNRARKRNVFPLEQPATRARRAVDSLLNEQPVLIDPAGGDDPRDHIRFRRNKPYALTERGRVTIDLLKLNRTTLDPSRLKHLHLVETLQALAGMDETSANLTKNQVQAIVDARASLAKLQLPAAPFSAMTMDFLAA